MGEERQDARITPPGRKLAVSEAAAELGISAEAVRSRIKRGTVRSVKEGSTVYVLLGADQPPPGQSPNTDQTTAEHRPDELADELRDRIRYLERQVEEEREARRRADTLLAQLMQRIPELEAPREAAGAPESASEPVHRETPFTDEERPQEPAQRRSWWRRYFGF